MNPLAWLWLAWVPQLQSHGAHAR